ncbi:hypothetical protein BDW74DRAFT_178742 [Aspergillus multicolor]|uniref:cupredoxin domain-containing protein n=1 Tax=Aspergillus multicolor TaxID=41759 RepID=UPI003CCD7A05
MSSNQTSTPEPTTISNPDSLTSTISPAVDTHTIKVGPKEDPHGYWPHTLEADVGDLVVFEFYPRNHSVVQADWKAPCVPAGGDYFYSGIKNEFNEVNGQVVGRLPTWNITVETNENETMTWESQYAAALDAPYMLVPGQSVPAEGENTNVNPATSTNPYITSSTSSTASPETSSHSSSSSLSAGAIAGIAIGCVVFVAILCVLLFTLGRNQVYKRWISASEPGGGSMNAVRTAKWALSTSVRGSGSGGGRSDAGAGGVGRGGGDLGPTPGAELEPSAVHPWSGSGLENSGLGIGSHLQDHSSSLRQSTAISSIRGAGGGYESAGGVGPAQEFGSEPGPGLSPPLSGSQVIEQCPDPSRMREGTSELEGSRFDR